VQAAMDWELAGPNTRHTVQVGVRYHEDEEDRLQRNDTWQQRDGRLVLNDVGLLGNAGNRVQNAKALSAFIHDRIEWNAWTFTPGLRFESIDLSRVDYDISGEDPASRNPDNVKSVRSNEVDVWIPGIGLLFDFNDELRLVAGVHRGFSTPGNKPGVDPEESVNYELGLRWTSGRVALDVMGFYNDYENLVGVCTNSSGADCEPGDSFNGKGASVPGIEVSFYAGLENDTGWAFPVNLTYTWMDAEFQDSFDSDFFGEVMKGDPVPYIPNQQARASLGAEFGKFAGYISYTFVDGVCTQAACGAFEKTEAAHLFDLGLHYRLNERWEIYGIGENLADEVYIAGRDPYGARPDKSRSFTMGVRFDF
jgi:Fe(3+) dicitrate transport protein